MIKGIGFSFDVMKFPVGETHVKLHSYFSGVEVGVVFDFEKTDEIITLMLLVNALKHAGLKFKNLYLSYVPFGRQDRVAVHGECFSLEVFADIINGLGAERVFVTDPHSDVTTALIKNCVINSQEAVFERILGQLQGNFYLISPDGGALKKIYKTASLPSLTTKCLGVVECSKIRDVRSGAILKTVVHTETLDGFDCVVLDDICDGGRTFIEIAKALKKKKAGKIILCVTHGFFTKGLDVFEGLFDEIYTKNGVVGEFNPIRVKE